MTITYMAQPQNKLTLGATVLTNTLLSAKVKRMENSFDTATIILPDTSYYPSTVTQGTTVLLEVKDAADSSYVTLFVGTVRFVISDVGEARTLTLSCQGIGVGLNEMLVAEEYGTQSLNGLDNIQDILTDATDGIIPKYVQKIMGGSNSNYSYDTSNVTDVTGTIPYIAFPYKPADKCLNDLCDLVTALGAGSTAGPHWITTYATSTVYLRLKLVTDTQTGWTKYYGNSQANATLTYGVDYYNINLEKLSAEANYIVYYGAWRRPSNGDYWTENNASAWNTSACDISDDTDAGDFKVNTASIKFTSNHAVNIPVISYPSTGDWHYDFSSDTFKDFNVPSLKVWLKRSSGSTVFIDLVDGDGDTFRFTAWNSATGAGPMSDPDRWYHIEAPIGDFCNTNGEVWDDVDGAVWSDICAVMFVSNIGTGAGAHTVWVDGLHFGDAAVCRVAALSDYTGVITKQRLIVDDIGKDDSLVASDDSGLMAQLAYAELLRQQTTSLIGTVETPMIKDLLPGQWLYIQSTDYRVTQIEQSIEQTGYKSLISVTSDTLNSRPRIRYEDINKQFAAIRPEWQDRQASNMKAGNVDIRIERLVKTY